MEEVIIGGNRKVRRVYGFDDVSIVPSDITLDPEDTETEIKIGEYSFTAPFLASAMDGVVDVKFAIEMGKLGGHKNGQGIFLGQDRWGGTKGCE